MRRHSKNIPVIISKTATFTGKVRDRHTNLISKYWYLTVDRVNHFGDPEVDGRII
jgi:hypothetical protein